MFVNLEICEQNWDLSSKIGQKKNELLERKIGGKKSKIDSSLMQFHLAIDYLKNMTKGVL